MSFWASVLLSGALYFGSTGLGTLAALAWLAPVPVLWYGLSGASGRRSATAAFLAFAIGGTNLLPLYLRVLPPVPLVLALAAPAAAFAGIVTLTRLAGRGVPRPLGPLVFATLATAWDLASTNLSPHGSAGSVGYSQAGVPEVAALASVAGLPAIVFAISLLAGCLAFAARRSGSPPRWRLDPGLLLAGGGVVGLVFAFGVLRPEPAGQRVVRVGLAALDSSLDDFGTRDRARALAVVDTYAAQVRSLGARGAQIVVLPEKMVTLREGWIEEAQQRLAAAAVAARVTLVAGLDERLAGDARRNLAVVISPGGQLVASYEKHHLVPGWEARYGVGKSLAWAAPGVGVAICKDMDFPALSREYARAGASLLLVPAWDFGVDGELHARMAMLRGVENGFAVARSAQEGRLVLSDARGRVVSSVTTGRQGPASAVADLRVGAGATPYTRLGDAFALANLPLAAVLTIPGLVRRRG